MVKTALNACRDHLVQAATFSALLNLLYLAPSIYMLQVYDRAVPTRGVMTLAMLSLIFVFAVLTISALDLIRSRILVRASARLDRLLSGPILLALLRSKRDNARSSAILRDFDGFRQTVTGLGMLALFDAPWAPIYIIVCFMLHWSLGLMALVGALILMFITWRNERATSDPVKVATQAANLAYRGIDGSLMSAGVVKALGMREALVARHLGERRESMAVQVGASFSSAYYVSMTKAFRLMLQSLALGLGALLAIEQQISGGAIFAASLLISRALAPIEQITGAWKNVVQARTSYTSISELLDEAGPPKPSTLLPPPQGELRVDHLSVISPARDRLLLNDISFHLAAGESLGIVGASGAGKSTLVKALAGAMEIHNGAVRIDGASLADWPESQLAEAIGYVPQEASLFRGTIKENIARFQTELSGNTAAIDAEVVRAASMCGAHAFILRLPNAYETELGWGGTGLSVGQAQRVALSRGLYGNPRVVILDEPNANLDAEGEQSLIDALAWLREQKVTVLIVAHRTGILSNVDKLLVMREGRIERFGRREDVVAQLAQTPQVARAAPPPPQPEAA